MEQTSLEPLHGKEKTILNVGCITGGTANTTDKIVRYDFNVLDSSDVHVCYGYHCKVSWEVFE